MADIDEAKLQFEREKLKLEADKLEFEKRKFDSEAEKRNAEKAKARADALKTRLEAKEMIGPFWKRPAWVTPVMQGVAVIIAVAGSLYSFTLNQQIAQSDSAAANAQLQASEAKLEAAQAKLDVKQSEIDKQKAVDQQSLAEQDSQKAQLEATQASAKAGQAEIDRQKAVGQESAAEQKLRIAEQKSQKATKELEGVQGQIVAEKKELDVLKYHAAIAPVETLLGNLFDLSFLPSYDQKRLLDLLTPNDLEVAKQRKKFLQSVVDDPNVPINKRLAALKALFTNAQSGDSPTATALKDKFIQLATSPIATSAIGENPFIFSKWEALTEVLGEKAGQYICDEYQIYANRGLVFYREREQMSHYIVRRFLSEPKCATAQWDFIDPRMDSISLFLTQGKLLRELALARYSRYIEKGITTQTDSKFATHFLVWGTFVNLDWHYENEDSLYGWSVSSIQLIRSLNLPVWDEPESNHVDWQPGENFVSALTKWPTKHQKLVQILSEDGLPHLRKCNMKVLQMILLDVYVGEPEIEQNCPADTLK